ncbi:MAG: thioredoxin domain-containing protein [Ferruginibacter sp.]|nr:thioredoxin domain-containing protein [Ferruginibacter sp.]
MPNNLINETSPYLLQHAHNPVNWYAWGDEALQLAKNQNKPILISIGYAACHWCHVMEKESFENEAVAKIMNDNFINIKVDREERPDIDAIYMDAVQAISGSGGWPLNVFLTPEAKPFYGGTYFPPINAYNRLSWTEVLLNIKTAWLQRNNEILTQAETLIEHFKKSDFSTALKNNNIDNIYTKENCETICKNILQNADEVWGGFGNAPKFPQTLTIQYLLQYYYFSNDEAALSQALLSIDKMLDGGIYDHLAGGLARYSTDKAWLAPHFEKMLYDNALLLNILADAFSITKNEKYSQAIHHIIHFLQNEMEDKQGGFYAAIDADSEGVEGKFYTWQKKEVEEILGTDAELFCEYYDVTDEGNWEHTNILRILKPLKQFAIEKNIEESKLQKIINDGKQKLLQHRNKRIRPITDDKILLSWNAMLVTALCKCGAATNHQPYIDKAVNTFTFLIQKFTQATNKKEFYHTYKNGIAKYPAFLDDYAALIQAAIHLQEVTTNTKYLTQAKNSTQFVITHFFDEASGFFYYTHNAQTDIILRKKEVYDGATPSGNAIMAQNLFYLSIAFNEPTWYSIASKMLANLSTAVIKYPSSFAIWAGMLLNQTIGIQEITIMGEQYKPFLVDVLQFFAPNKVIQASKEENSQFPLLANKPNAAETLIYRCFNYTCSPAINTTNELYQVLKQINKFA